LPSTRAGEYFHNLTESAAAWRSIIGPLTAAAETTFPMASMLAETVTVPCTLDSFAAVGYTGRVEESNCAARMVLNVAAGAGGFAEAKAAAGAGGGVEVRPEAVSRFAEGTAPADSATAISVTGADASPALARAGAGALGVAIFKLGITGSRAAAGAGWLAALFSDRFAMRDSLRGSALASAVGGLFTTAGSGGK